MFLQGVHFYFTGTGLLETQFGKQYLRKHKFLNTINNILYATIMSAIVI
jgi:hypothetical protein